MNSRAVSEVFGNLLILIIIAITISVMLSYGYPVIMSGQEKVKMRNVISSMVFAKEKIEVVSSDVEPCTTLKFPPSGGALSVSKSCTLYVYVNGKKLGYVPEKPGELLYTSGNWKVAVELGGVWESDGSRSWMVYPPLIKVAGGNVVVTVPAISGTGSAGGYGIANVLLSYNSTEVHDYADSYLKLVVQTEFPQAWENYLKDSGFAVTVSGDTVTATASGNVTLVVHWINVSIY